MAAHRQLCGTQARFDGAWRAAAAGAIGIVAVSCSGPTSAPAPIDTADQEIEALRAEIDDLKLHHEKQTDQLAAAIRERYEVQLQQVRSEREAKEAALEGTIEDLRGTVARLEDRIRTLTRQPPAAPGADAAVPPTPDSTIRISRFEPPRPDAADFILVPTGPDPDLFPVEITNIKGRRVVTGTHTSTRQVPIGETYRDSFGEIKRRMVEQPVEVNDYKYEVVCTLRNQTRQTQSVTVRAGNPPVPVLLDPGEDREIAVDWNRGASLTIGEGSFSRSFPVILNEDDMPSGGE